MTSATTNRMAHRTSSSGQRLQRHVQFRFCVTIVHSARWLLSVSLLLMLASAARSEEPGWYPHEGGLLKYRVNIRFGEEPEDTMPAGWKFGRVSAVAVDPAGTEVYVFQRGKKADPLIVFDSKGKYLRSWGKRMFGNPHRLRVDRERNVFVTDT